jgi:hypothetical protein
LANHRDAGPSYIPDADPGRYGGGTYTSQNVEPTIEAYENIFGPSARDIKVDLQRFKRHGRWHLPDVLKGPNTYLTDRVDGLITDATNSPFTSKILPYKYMQQPDGKIKWNVWSFDEGLASRVPYESAARTLTQSKKSYSGYMVRQGMAIVLEHNFMMSDAGRINFKRQLQQLVGSIQLTNDLDVHVALLLAPSYQKDIREKYISDDKTSSQICREFIDLFGFVQKNQNAMDILIEEAKSQLKMWGGPMPSFLMCNSKLTFQLTMTPDVTNFVTHGSEGQKRLKAGPDLPSYRGINVMHTRAFAMEPGAPPRDVLRRRVRVAEYYRIKPHPDNWKRQFQFYNEERDTWFSLTFKELLQYARTNGPDGAILNLLDADLPGHQNHGMIDRQIQMLHAKVNGEAGAVAHAAPPRLGMPVEINHADPSYQLTKELFKLMFLRRMPIEYSWRPFKLSDNLVYVPGVYTPAKEYGAAVGTTYDMPELYDRANWHVLPSPIRDALVEANAIDPHDFDADRTQRKLFLLITQSVQTYPRFNPDIVRHYFFEGQYVAGHVAGTGFEDFNRDSALPDCFNFARHAAQNPPRFVISPNYVLNPALAAAHAVNRVYDWDHLKSVYHFYMYNRYSIGENIVRRGAYQVQNTYAAALDYDNNQALYQLNATPSTSGEAFYRDCGAFFCPNYFKYQHANNFSNFGNLIGWNLIANQELVYWLTMSRKRTGEPKPGGGGPFNIDLDELQWNKDQWTNTFLYDVLENPGKHALFLEQVRLGLEQLYGVMNNGAFADIRKTRAWITKQFLYGARDSFHLGGSTFSNAVVNDPIRDQEFWVPGIFFKTQHYWFWPRADCTRNEVLSMSNDDFRDATAHPPVAAPAAGAPPNPPILSFKQMLINANVQDHLDLGHDLIGFFADQNIYNQIFDGEKNSNFLTAEVRAQDQHQITIMDAKNFLHTLAYRFWADQELDRPVVWSERPIQNIILDHRLPLYPVNAMNVGAAGMPWGAGGVPGLPAPGGPGGGGGGGWGGPQRGPAGSEDIEIVVVRPNIEHYMLGIILGQGGDSLGNTFWGQTELSCYDDSMHGIWGMSYKYHSRAVVINTKNLVRLWDIAYDGYVGGKDDTHVDWTDRDSVERFVETTNDVSKHYRGQAMMVMAFDHSERKNLNRRDMYDRDLKANWPSPIVFYDTTAQGQRQGAHLALDYDNIHVADTSMFHVFNKDIYRNAYKVYQSKMPDFFNLHRIRKNAALAAVENEVTSDALAFQGTMRVLNESGNVIEEILGSGHHGPDFIGVASLRAGKGYKFNAQPTMQRLV